MKFSLGWLRRHLSFAIGPEDLAKHLLLMGFEVVESRALGPGFSGVVVGEILEVGRHPNADRLSLCSVRVGPRTLSIVCGAPNVRAGAKVPVAAIGARLPGGRTIERVKIRGVESEGMICSAPELGLEESDGGGVLLLPPEAAAGADAAGLLGEADHVLDLDIPPNRPDCLSHFGLARELSIHFGTVPKPPPDAEPVADPSIRARPAELPAQGGCRRYVGRELKDVRIGPSPGWLVKRLEAVGLRSVNNAVDATNYVLLELGHPLHAFDADKLRGDRISVRRARTGERLRALDGREYALGPEDLVIADGSGPVALAGVIGGEPCGVTEKTRNLFLEAAHFAPGLVRSASRRLGCRTDSSYRFERGVPPESAGRASARAAALILELCGGKSGAPLDAYPERTQPSPIRVTAERVNRILGASFPAEKVESLLQAMAERVARSGPELRFYPPSHRLDLATPWDLAEEVARHLGYDLIPEEAGPVRPQRPKPSPGPELAAGLRGRLAHLGFYEAYNYDFVSKEQLLLCGLDPASARAAEVLNPVSEDQAFLRPSLLVGLLASAARNRSHGVRSLRLFEVGRVFSAAGAEVLERTRLSGLLLGEFPAAPHWRRRPSPDDFYEAKGIAADLLEGFDAAWGPPPEGEEPLLHPKASLQARTPQGAVLAAAGLLHPSVARAWGLQEPAAGFTLDLDLLASLPVRAERFVPFSPFPSVTRDLAVVIEESVPYARVEESLRRAGGIPPPELLDVYVGPGIPKGSKSLALRFTLRSMERTLKDAEAQELLARALKALADGCGARLRS